MFLRGQIKNSSPRRVEIIPDKQKRNFFYSFGQVSDGFELIINFFFNFQMRAIPWGIIFRLVSDCSNGPDYLKYEECLDKLQQHDTVCVCVSSSFVVVPAPWSPNIHLLDIFNAAPISANPPPTSSPSVKIDRKSWSIVIALLFISFMAAGFRS